MLGGAGPSGSLPGCWSQPAPARLLPLNFALTPLPPLLPGKQADAIQTCCECLLQLSISSSKLEYISPDASPLGSAGLEVDGSGEGAGQRPVPGLWHLGCWGWGWGGSQEPASLGLTL